MMRSLFLVLLASTCVSACDTAKSTPVVQVAPSQDASVEAPLVVSVSSDGVVRVDGELLDDSSILNRARDYHEAHARGKAIVVASPAVLHGRMIRVVELLQEARVSSIAIELEH